MRVISVPSHYYQQFDADFSREFPAEGYGGWKETSIDIDLDRTALVMMHVWDCGTREQYPGWYRGEEYFVRAQAIGRTVFPPLLSAFRSHQVQVFHVVLGETGYYNQYPGYQKALELTPQKPAMEYAQSDPILDKLRKFKTDHGFPGAHNQADGGRGWKNVNFDPNAKPEGEEGVAKNADQLFALCQQAGINHLIYAGFAIDACLLMSPGGMVDMDRRGLMCSVFRQGVTAVENKETARGERAKELGLWRVAVNFGFVLDVTPFIGALPTRD